MGGMGDGTYGRNVNYEGDGDGEHLSSEPRGRRFGKAVRSEDTGSIISEYCAEDSSAAFFWGAPRALATSQF